MLVYLGSSPMSETRGLVQVVQQRAAGGPRGRAGTGVVSAGAKMAHECQRARREVESSDTVCLWLREAGDGV